MSICDLAQGFLNFFGGPHCGGLLFLHFDTVMMSPFSLYCGKTFLQNWRQKKLLYIGDHGPNAPWLHPWCSRLTFHRSNTFVSCIDEPCNDLFNDSKLKDRWSNM